MADTDKLAAGGRGREKMSGSLVESQPDVSTVCIALMQRLSDHERRAREFKEAVQIRQEGNAYEC